MKVVEGQPPALSLALLALVICFNYKSHLLIMAFCPSLVVTGMEVDGGTASDNNLGLIDQAEVCKNLSILKIQLVLLLIHIEVHIA